VPWHGPKSLGFPGAGVYETTFGAAAVSISKQQRICEELEVVTLNRNSTGLEFHERAEIAVEYERVSSPFQSPARGDAVHFEVHYSGIDVGARPFGEVQKMLARFHLEGLFLYAHCRAEE